MSADCCEGACSSQATTDPRYRKALWIALGINSAMFALEIATGLKADSVSLFADAVDFAGDAATYGISLAVLSMSFARRSRAAWIKGMTMAVFGLFVLGRAGWAMAYGTTPQPFTMGGVAIIALIANGSIALILYTFRNGDANMRSVWLCSRNDAVGNIAVMLAAGGVFGTGSRWPDLVVATVMAGLALAAGIAIMRQSKAERSEASHGAGSSARSAG